MSLNLFYSNQSKFASAFTPAKLMDKIGGTAKKAGLTPIYYALALYNSLTDPNMSATNKVLITAALGYFILPVDAIPDVMPGGLIDDTGVLAVAMKTVKGFISNMAQAKAKDQLKKWFGNVSESDLIRLNK